MGHPNQKLEGEKGLELTLLLCHEHDASVLCAVGERHRNRWYGLGDVECLVDTEVNAKRAQQTLEFLIELVGNKTNADVDLNAALCEVENWTSFKWAFGDAPFFLRQAHFFRRSRLFVLFHPTQPHPSKPHQIKQPLSKIAVNERAVTRGSIFFEIFADFWN